MNLIHPIIKTAAFAQQVWNAAKFWRSSMKLEPAKQRNFCLLHSIRCYGAVEDSFRDTQPYKSGSIATSLIGIRLLGASSLRASPTATSVVSIAQCTSYRAGQDDTLAALGLRKLIF